MSRTIERLEAENERLRAALQEIATIDVGAGNMVRPLSRTDFMVAFGTARQVACEALGSAAAGGDSVDTLDRFECAFCGKKFATAYVRGHHEECCDGMRLPDAGADKRGTSEET
jgi:hypothetical protein